jgi:type II secretory pathway component PulK
VLEALVAQAKAGDTGAIKLILERTVPALRPVDAVAPLNLPVAGGLADQGRAVLAALVAGQLPANQAAGILQGLGNLAKLVELDELEKRVTALEGKQG